MKAKKHRDGFDYKGFARRLRRNRIALGLSEEEAAAAAGRTIETWRHYENTGRGHITEPLLRFCEKYNVSLDWLFDDDGPRHRRGGPNLRLIHSDISIERTTPSPTSLWLVTEKDGGAS
jgi:transcriptional regulator with XRE-family HTH domain